MTNNTPQVERTGDQSSLLTANLTSGSGGVDLDVSHQATLGVGGLPDRHNPVAGGAGPRGLPMVEGRASSVSPGPSRSEEEIQEVLDRHKADIYLLYARELREDSSLQGRLLMSVTIAPEGHVTSCKVLSSQLNSRSLEHNLVALVRGIHFGNKPGVPEVSTRIPIEFFPR